MEELTISDAIKIVDPDSGARAQDTVTKDAVDRFLQACRIVCAAARRAALENTDYLDGVKYAIYEIFKEADIPGSQEIRDSGDTDDGMCARAAEKIRAELEKAIAQRNALAAKCKCAEAKG